MEALSSFVSLLGRVLFDGSLTGGDSRVALSRFVSLPKSALLDGLMTGGHSQLALSRFVSLLERVLFDGSLNGEDWQVALSIGFKSLLRRVLLGGVNSSSESEKWCLFILSTLMHLRGRDIKVLVVGDDPFPVIFFGTTVFSLISLSADP